MAIWECFKEEFQIWDLPAVVLLKWASLTNLTEKRANLSGNKFPCELNLHAMAPLTRKSAEPLDSIFKSTIQGEITV